MSKDNMVMFKGKGNGLTVVLDEKADFSEIADAMELKVADARGFLGSAETVLQFAGRKLSKSEEAKLLEIIKRSSDLSVRHKAEEAAKPKEAPAPFSAYENPARFHMGSLRSGQSLRFAGSVVVLGDVNPGAEIIADGSIIVLGALKGLAHAGCSGAEGCYIAALKLAPTQLRIADRITYIPKDTAKDAALPSYAFVEDGRIFVSPLMK